MKVHFMKLNFFIFFFNFGVFMKMKKSSTKTLTLQNKSNRTLCENAYFLTDMTI